MPTTTVQQLAIPNDSCGELTEYVGSTADSGLLRAHRMARVSLRSTIVLALASIFCSL